MTRDDQESGREFPGFYWLPDTPENRVSGVLTISPSGRARLSLIGELRSPFAFAPVTHNPDGSTRVDVTADSQDQAGRYERVLGQAAATYLTLEDGFQTRHRTTLFGGMPTEELVFNQCFEGAAFEHGEMLEFDRLRFDLQHLTEFIDQTGLTESIRFATSDSPRVHTFELTSLPNQAVSLNGDVELLLQHHWAIEGDGLTHRTLRQGFAFEIRHTKVQPLPDLMKVAASLQALVTFGAGRPSGYAGVFVARPDITEGTFDQPDKYRKYVTYHAEWPMHDDEKKPLSSSSMLFALPELGGLDMLRRWHELWLGRQHQISMVISTKVRPGLVSDRLLYRIAALEGVHKLMSPAKANLSMRLSAMADLAGEPFVLLVGDVASWVSAVVAERNHIGHGSLSDFEAVDVLLLADSAYWLFLLCLLRELGAPDTLFENAAANQEFHWLRRRLASRNSA